LGLIVTPCGNQSANLVLEERFWDFFDGGISCFFDFFSSCGFSGVVFLFFASRLSSIARILVFVHSINPGFFGLFQPEDMFSTICHNLSSFMGIFAIITYCNIMKFTILSIY